jgi:hypothetical protein
MPSNESSTNATAAKTTPAAAAAASNNNNANNIEFEPPPHAFVDYSNRHYPNQPMYPKTPHVQ